MYRSQVYNESRFFRLTPVGRIDVVPGESMDLNSKVRMRSPNFINPALSGGMALVASFYVPYRLLWDGWIDFVTQRDGTGSTVDLAAQVPISDVSSGFLLERRNGNRNVWGRRAYKLIYNQFFGDKDMGQYYPQIDDDANVSTPYGVRALEQFLSKLVMTGSITEQTYTLDTSGPTASIPLNQFRHEMETARMMRRRDMTGNKYVDALLNMGVKLDWRVQNAPELLSLQKVEFNSQITPAVNKSGNTDADQTLGQFSSYYDCTVNHRTGRKFFAEHGVVMTVAVMRPHLFNESAAGSIFSLSTTYDGYYWGDNMEGALRAISGGIVGAAGGSNASMGRFQMFESGQNLMGAYGQQPWVLSRDVGDVPPSIDDVVYPTVTRVQNSGNVLGSTQVVCYAEHQAVLQTPIPKGVHRI